MSGADTPAGTLDAIKTALLTIVGIVAPSGVVNWLVGTNYAGSNTPTGETTKQPATSMSGSDTPTATLLKNAIINVGGAIPQHRHC
jgi:hypothetical protein